MKLLVNIQSKWGSYPSIWGRIFELNLHVSLFLVFFELAAGYSYYLMELSLILLLISFFIMIAVDYYFSPRKIFNVIIRQTKKCWFLVTSLFLYIAWDCFSALKLKYSDSGDFLGKYKVVLLMIFLSICLLFYLSDEKKINRILYNIMAAGIFSSLFSILNYAIFRIYPIYYGKRLSIRLDYNMFASVLIMGLLTGFFLLLQSKMNWKWNICGLVFLLEILIPVIVLSSSRRNYSLLFPILVLMFLDFAIVFSKHKSLLYACLIAAGTALLIWLTIILLNMYLSYSYQFLLNSDKGEYLSSGESSVEERYETIKQEKENSKRGLIWGIAFDEIKKFDKRELAIGKGFGYDRYIYTNVSNEELDKAYTAEAKLKLSAHCFVLADLLNGGYIQVILSVLLWVGIGVMLLVLLGAYPIFSQLYVIAFSLIFINNFISNRYGFLYDKYFWIFLILLIAEIRLIYVDQRRIFHRGRNEF